MYEVCIAIQYIGIVALMLELVYVVKKETSRAQLRLILCMVGMIINFVGYLFEMTSKSMEQALMAVKIIYVGKPVIIFSMLFFVMGYCKVNMSNIMKTILILIHTGISCLVLFCEKNTLYYNKIEFVDEGLFPHLKLGHGIVYKLFALLMVAYFVAIFVVAIRRFRTSNNKYIKKNSAVLILVDLICCTGYGLFLLRVTNGYDTTLPSLLISTFLMSYCLSNYSMLDMVATAKDYAMNQFNDGIVLLDYDDDIVYENNLARNIKHKLGCDDIAFVDYIEEVIKDKKIKAIGENAYQFSKDYVETIKGQKCKMYLLLDVTDSYNYTERLENAVNEKTKQVVYMQRTVISSFATMIEARDGITGMHIKNTSNYVAVLVKALQQEERYKSIINDEYGQMVMDAAALHDIGKISVPDQVLQKPGKLTPEEYEIIKKHPTEGANIIKLALSNLEKDEYLEIAKDMAYSHHERWDGKGYPKGLKGEEIPLSARIMAIADVYDALRSRRHYKEAFDVEKSCNIIKEGRFTQFDGDLVDVFLAHIKEIEVVRE